MDRKEILNSLPDKFLVPVYKSYLYATLPPSLSHINKGLDLITFSTSHQVGLTEFILNIPDRKKSNSKH